MLEGREIAEKFLSTLLLTDVCIFLHVTLFIMHQRYNCRERISYYNTGDIEARSSPEIQEKEMSVKK